MTAPQLAPGTVVAQKYRLGACLGYAGSSATYQAASAEGRDVVLKIFDPSIRQRSDIMAAIEQTYAATNALPQDVAVPLLDAGYDAGTGAPFSVSERIPFPSLAQLVAQRPLTPDEVANVVAVLGQLLDRAHAQQLFHHALKPTNIFVGFAQGYGVRVTDFGAGLPRTAVPTQEGYALAAPWLAPEQVQQGAQAAGGADVLAVALIAFFALTGRSYWRSCQGQLDLAGWQQEIMGARTPPSARALQLGVTLSSAFDNVLGAALSVDPNQRYRSVGELSAGLEAVISAKAPESQATMAFPAGAMGMGGPGDYPPAPQPSATGLPSAALMTQQSPGAAPPPHGAMAQSAQPSMPDGGGYPGAGPYVSNQGAPGGNLGETAAGRPIEPGIHQRRAPVSRAAPIIVGVVALLLLGGAAAAFFVLGKKPPADQPAASASADDTSAPADTGTAAPADTGTAAPADTGTAAPADSAQPAASGEPDAGAAPIESTLACDPECDEIKVDDKAIEIGKPLVLKPGKHVVTGTKAGYLKLRETVVVKDGEKVEKTFKLTEVPSAPVRKPSGPAKPSKPCGKFLKRCK
jgi:eukaryotic-like serine/threonine-protein kinase